MRLVLSTMACALALGAAPARAQTCVDALVLDARPVLRRALRERLTNGLLAAVPAAACEGVRASLRREGNGWIVRATRSGATVRRSVSSPETAAMWIESWLVPDAELGPSTEEAELMSRTNGWRAALIATGIATTASPTRADLPPAPWADTHDVPGATTSAAPAARAEPIARERAEALRALERDAARFVAQGAAYRDTVAMLLARRSATERRNLTHAWDRRILAELRAETRAREQAIRRFERFLALHPNDDAYTPGAMHRLGELYYEETLVAFHATSVDGAVVVPDYERTIALYRDLLRRFPAYEQTASVQGLLGYYLSESGRLVEAREAWLALLCPAHEDGGRTDAYATCRPLVDDDRTREAWFRLGEQHFDDTDDASALELAIGAYRHVTAHPDDRRYSMALYKIAWAFYRANRYPEAVAHFAQLVDWSDAEEHRTGHAGSELRPEAIQYIAFSLAWDDWDSDGSADADGAARAPGVVRVAASSLVPQDRPWTPEVYRALGAVYADEARYADAITVWRALLDGWPASCARDEVLLRMVAAHDLAGEPDGSFDVLAELGEGTDSLACAESGVLASAALVEIAYRHHRRAQERRRLCGEVGARSIAACREADEQYRRAVTAYERYLARHPNADDAHEVRFHLAEAMYWSGRYEDAARAYAAVRDSNVDDRHLAEAARGVVESLERLAEAASLMRAREEAVIESAPVAMPELLRRVGRARDTYLARVPASADGAGLRAAYDFNNALLAARFGHLPHARARLAQILASGPPDTREPAWVLSRDIAIALSDDAEVARLAAAATSGSDCIAIRGRCGDPAHAGEPACIACADTTALCFREAQAAARPELLIACVDRAPEHEDALAALEQAALLFAESNRHPDAIRVYERIVAATDGSAPGDRARLDALLAGCLFGIGHASERLLDLERAAASYARLVDSPQLASSADPSVVRAREDALVNLALLLERMQRYDLAEARFRRVAESVSDPNARRSAAFRAAELASRRGDDRAASRAMSAFLDDYGRDPEAAELTVRAALRRAEAERRLGHASEAVRALRDTVARFVASGLAAGSAAAEDAATAHFALVEEEQSGRARFTIDAGQSADVPEYIARTRARIEDGARRASEVVAAYERIVAYQRPAHTIVAMVRQGEVYEALATGIREARFTLPRDVQRQLRGVPLATRDDVEVELRATVSDALEPRAREVECFAIVRYVLASRIARRATRDDEQVRRALGQLAGYGAERVGVCVEDARTRDPSLEPLSPEEIARAPAGRIIVPPIGPAPPALESR